MKRRLFVVLLMFAAGYCYGENLYKAQLDNAEAGFAQGDFTKSIEIYNSLIKVEKVNNPYVYYNLANAYYRAGQIGEAVLNSEKAYRLKPRDKDIYYNKLFLTEKAGLKNKEGAEAGISRILNLLSLNEATAAVSVLLILILTVSSACLIRPRRILKIITAALIVCILPFSVILASRINNEIFSSEAVVLSDVQVRSGPGANNPEVFNLPAGYRVFINGQSNGWYAIKADSDKLTGWTEAANIGKING